MTTIIIASLASAILAFTLAAILVTAAKFFHTEVDEKVEKIMAVLPLANCGACGKAGCAQLASAIAKDEASVDACTVGGSDVAKAIAEIVGKTAPEPKEKTRAFIFCHGFYNISFSHKMYEGISKCAAANLIGGNKDCSYGCLGFKDCMEACKFGAIVNGEGGIPDIVEEKCSSCGACVKACPKKLIEIHPVSQKFHIYCRSHDRGPMAKKQCQKACIACGICAKNVPEVIKVKNFLAEIDYANYHLNEENTKGCPSGALTGEDINVVR